MAFPTLASFPRHEQNTAKPILAENGNEIADFLGIPASDSLASVASQYHSALSSPIPCEASEPSTERDLISFTPDDLAQFVTYSKAMARPASPPCTISKPPTSPEFSSNHHGLEPLRKPGLVPDMDEAGKTPNVYINGLPPHFRDDQLHAIAAPFGEIVSVRCFTRNSTKNPSGYGFVLFKTIAAAEKCIMTLKRSDLHPSFSKVNKPPRLVNSPDSSAFSTQPSSASLGSDPDSPLPGSPELDFKAKMARLEDKNSPNVYIEGLPMSADKNTLIELVYPYIIQSTRFIRSKVPQSQTMIAFMRMETRAAAEDVIRRLNGKTIRGWDGAESRVYLRIADTLDQRELRRSEASSREDEPGRLTIAQATLLNYRAKQQLQSTAVASNLLGLGIHNNGRPAEGRVPDPLAAAVHELLTGNPGARAQRLPAPPPPVNRCAPDALPTLPHPLAANIHNVLAMNPAQNQNIIWPTAPTSFSFPLFQDPLYAPYTCPPPASLPANMHPNVAALFESLAAMQMQQQRPSAQGPPVYPPPMAGFPNHFNTNANVNMQAQAQKFRHPNLGPFMRTPAENFVMQARAELQNLAGDNRNINPRLNNTSLPPSAPTAFQRPTTITTREVPLLQRPVAPQAQPQSSFVNPVQARNISLQGPARNVPPPPAAPRITTISTHVSNPSLIDIPQNANHMAQTTSTNDKNGRVRQSTISVGFPSAHARASTAPVVSRVGLQNNEIDNDIDHTLIPVRWERLFTNANANDTNANTNANRNTNANANTTATTNTNANANANANTNMNMNAKPVQIQNQNLSSHDASAPRTNSNSKSAPAPAPPPMSTRVFLGPQNVVHLPVLRFA
ncbi:RRM domain-containing protein [Mycena sanguinolenta]|uniref:RRM domain-containing protein n=1 Tax=Mycena sanguinolenta TaxID=230812 RepID=A0A8H7CPU8_9AGAR|nr:RRM domain-containing protein [Mycena sanguinolenta]